MSQIDPDDLKIKLGIIANILDKLIERVKGLDKPSKYIFTQTELEFIKRLKEDMGESLTKMKNMDSLLEWIEREKTRNELKKMLED